MNSLRFIFVRNVLILILAVFCLASGSAFSQRLPSMSKAPWLGFFSGYETRDFQMGVDDEGKVWLFLLDNKKERTGSSRWIKVFTEISIEGADGKRTAKWLKDDEGFASDQEMGLKHKEVKYTALTTGNAKIEVTVKYTRKGAILDGRILDAGELAGKGKLFLRFKVSVPAMYSPSYKNEDEKSEQRMEKDKLRFVRAKDKKRITVGSYKDVDLSTDENAKDGVLELRVEMDGMEGKEFLFTTEDKKGVFYFENSKPGVADKLWQGYKVIWEREMGSEKEKGGIQPFVIEVK